MGFPAARVTDNHLCPMVTPGLPPVPHVGGPITGPGVPTVLIGNLPAATLGDMCVCVGPPDSIIKGSFCVLIGGKPAARVTDNCVHGGMIVMGCPTVLIGDAPSPSTVMGMQASANGTAFCEICNKTPDNTPAPNNAAPSQQSSPNSLVADKTVPKIIPKVPTAPVKITYGKNAKQNLSAHTIEVLKEIAASTGEDNILITSTQREPSDQARAMYDNLESKGITHQKELYGSGGDKVIDVYADGKKKGLSREQIESNMVDKMNEIGPSKVSKHVSDPNELNVVDIAPSSIKDKERFVKAIEADPRVSKLLKPPADPAYHLEIPQK